MTAAPAHASCRWARLCSWPVLVGLIAVGPYCSLLLSGDLVLKDSLYSDYASYQLPVREFAQQEFAAGRFPLWIPWLGCGIPLHATGQVGLCHPLVTPFLSVLDANRALKLSLFLHVMLCYAGQYRLGRMLSLSPPAASISGLIVAQGGFMTGHLVMGHVAHVLAMALVPWFFERLIIVCREPMWPAACRLAFVGGALLLAGNPQVPYYAFLFGSVWVIVSLIGGTAAEHRAKVVAMLMVSGTLTALLAAAQLVPTLELLRDNAGTSRRGGPEFAGSYALDALDLYRLAVPSLKGNPMVGLPEFDPPDFYHEKVCYLGIIAWLLAFTGLLYAARSDWSLGAAGLITFGIVIALGPGTIFFHAIGRVVPGLFLFRCPGRCLAVVSVFVALLAGRGLDSMCGPPQRMSRLRLTITAALLLVAAVFVCILLERRLSEYNIARWLSFAQRHLRGEIYASLLAFAASASVYSALAWWGTRQAALATLLVLALDLAYFNGRCIRFDARRIPSAPAAVQSIGDRYRFIEGPSYPRFFKSEVPYSKLVPEAATLRLRMIGTNEGGVLPAACERLFAALETNSSSSLRAASCRFAAQKTDKVTFTEVSGSLPRARWFPAARIAELSTPVDKLEISGDNAAFDGVRSASVELLLDEARRIVVKTVSDSDGVLLIADTWYPGWICTVDNVPRDVLRAYGCFRAVRVPAGTHVVEMQYVPNSFYVGAVLSIVGLFLLFTPVLLRLTRLFSVSSILMSTSLLVGLRSACASLPCGPSTPPA